MRQPKIFSGARAGVVGVVVLATAGATLGEHLVKAWRGDKPVAPAEFQTTLVSDFPGVRPIAPSALDEYGGLRGDSQKATGFFYPKKIDQRWWLIDPLGNRFIDIGVASLSTNNDSPTARQALQTNFGGEDQWLNATLRLLRENGFNSSGGFSNNQVLYGQKFVYTPSWSFMAEYGRQKRVTHADTGHTGYDNECIPAFDPEFETFCDSYAKRLAERKDDPYLLGCYSDNELPFPLDALDRYLKLPPKDPGRLAADAVLRERGSSVGHITDTDRQAFMYRLADRYFSVVSRAIKKYDPNHLYLGSRFNGPAPHNEALQRAAGKYVDVVSFNLYTVWTPNIDSCRRWTSWSGKPCIITEFYAKGVDSGMANDTGAGWVVATQKDRGEFYQTFTIGLLRSDVCVGWHWFKYQDNLPDDLKADRSNRHSNKGIVNGQYMPYNPLLVEMQQLNNEAYPLALWFDRSH